MSLPDYVADAVVELAHTDEFKTVWRFFKKQADLMVDEILSSSTDIASREVLVRVHELFRREVVNLPDMAIKQIEKRTAGDA